MITDEMIETGAKALVEAEYERNPSHKTLVSYARHDARAVLEAVLPMIRVEVLEEAAKVAMNRDVGDGYYIAIREAIAEAILAISPREAVE